MASSSAPIQVPTGANGQSFLGQGFADETKNKFKQHDAIIIAILVVTTISFVTLVISTYSIYMDQARFNNDAYMNSTQRTDPEAKALQAEVDDLNDQITKLNKQTENLSKQLDVAQKTAAQNNLW